MKILYKLFVTSVFLASCGVIAVHAQQGQDQSQPPSQSGTQQQTSPDQGATQPQGPIPAYRSPLAGAANNEDEETPTELTPDAHALTGVQTLGLGMPKAHSYWQPHLDIDSTVDSNPVETTGNGSWGSWTSFYGGVDVHQASANSNLDLTYVGGGMISNDSNVSNGVVQELSFSDRILFRRWALTLLDSLNYLPESAFGFGGLGSGTLPGGGTFGGGGPIGPGQTLLTGRGQNLGNTFATEADVFVTPRTSLTFSSGYSSLHYFDSDLLNYGTVYARAGYNYQMDRKNTVGIVYTYSDFNYSNFNQTIADHVFQVSYGRRVTGRLAFQVAVGPEISLFHQSISAGAGSTGGGEGTVALPSTQVGWSLGTNVEYALQRTSFGLGYFHGVGGGGGVLAGSDGDTVSGSITRQMSRTFSSGITGGYSRNRGLAAVGTTTPTPSDQTFDYWYVGANFSHPVGRTLALSVSYQMQYQDSGTAFCVVAATCGTNVIRHMISFGVGWHERPLRF